MKYSEMFLKLNKNENEQIKDKDSNSKRSDKNSKNNSKNSQNDSREIEDSSFRRSKRKIKVIKRDGYSSDEKSSKSFSSSLEEQENQMFNFNKEDNVDIIMTGNLIYRYSLDQIELEGFWSLNNDVTREKFSYLFIKKCDKITCPIKISEIEQCYKNNSNNNNEQLENTNTINNKINQIKSFCGDDPLNENYLYKDEYHLSICSANLFEAITISHPVIFNCITNYLTGEYHGFFFYYDKTIEDRFYINFDYDDNQVRINGEGTNNLGNFNLIGYINFYNMKDMMIKNNDLESETIKLGEFKITRLYNAFNPNENYRVIKSFQHRKKKGGEENSEEDE